MLSQFDIANLSQADRQKLARILLDAVRGTPDTEPPRDAPPADKPARTSRDHIDALATIGAMALARARINGEASNTGILRIGTLTTEQLPELALAKFERCVAEAELGFLEAVIASRSG